MPTRPLLPRLPLLLALALASLSSRAETPAAGAPAQRNAGALQVQAQPGVLLQVKRVTLEGNSLLPAESFASLLAALPGERSLSELQAAAAAVQQRFRAAGYGGVVAFVPEQSLADGVLRIRVVEGKLGDLTVRGTRHSDEALLRRALPALEPGRTPRLPEIDRQLQLLNENPSRQVRLLLQPGARSGSVAASVEVQDADPQRWHARADNSGTRASRARLGLGWQHADVAGLDHVLGLDLQTAAERPRSLAVLSANYRMPLHAHGVLLDAYAAYSDIDGGTHGTAAGDLSFSGKGHIAGLKAQWLLLRWGEVEPRLSLGVEQRAYRNDCRIAGLPDGACGAAGASVTLRPLTLGVQLQQARTAGLRWAFNLTLSRNLPGSGQASAAALEAARAQAEARYTVVRLQGSAAWPLASSGWALHARAQAQSSSSALVAGEQQGLGGAQGVRGYEERELLGDNALLASLELSSPNLLTSRQQRLQAVVFADAGQVRNHAGQACRVAAATADRPDALLVRCSALGLGLGLHWQWADFQLRLDAARAQREASLTRQGGRHVHLSLSHRF